MGLITFAIEALGVSAGIAAIRQYFDYSARDFVLPKIQHPLVKQVVGGYFEAGEYIVNSAVDFYKSYEEKK